MFTAEGKRPNSVSGTVEPPSPHGLLPGWAKTTSRPRHKSYISHHSNITHVAHRLQRLMYLQDAKKLRSVIDRRRSLSVQDDPLAGGSDAASLMGMAEPSPKLESRVSTIDHRS